MKDWIPVDQPLRGRAGDLVKAGRNDGGPRKVSTLRSEPRLVPSRQIVDGAKTYTAFSANDLLTEDDRAYQPWGLLV